jgi:hypothetical protein
MRKYRVLIHTFSTNTFIAINSYQSVDAANVEVVSDRFNVVSIPVKNHAYSWVTHVIVSIL